VWHAPSTDDLGVDLDQAAAHEHTSMLGVLMYANVRERRGQRLHIVTARPDHAREMDDLFRTIRSLAAARMLQGRTVLRIGVPYPGYLNIAAEAAQLAQLGLVEREISVGELEEAYDAVDAAQVEALASEVSGHGWEGEPDERGLRVAVAMRHLAKQFDAVCGAINCHGPLLRNNEHIGVPGCLGLSVCTAAGVPFSCMADTPTAVALALGRALAGRVLYCEFYAFEPATNSLLIANGGEGDVGWATETVELVPSAHYPGVNGAGTALAFDLPPGPVTVLSLSPIGDSWRLVWACGELIEARYPRMQAPNAMFRFSSADASSALDAWLGSGATHHNALVPGHLDLELPLVADALGIESREIGVT
jgi:L-arabinose isomerase